MTGPLQWVGRSTEGRLTGLQGRNRVELKPEVITKRAPGPSPASDREATARRSSYISGFTSSGSSCRGSSRSAMPPAWLDELCKRPGRDMSEPSEYRAGADPFFIQRIIADADARAALSRGSRVQWPDDWPADKHFDFRNPLSFEA